MKFSQARVHLAAPNASIELGDQASLLALCIQEASQQGRVYVSMLL